MSDRKHEKGSGDMETPEPFFFVLPTGLIRSRPDGFL